MRFQMLALTDDILFFDFMYILYTVVYGMLVNINYELKKVLICPLYFIWWYIIRLNKIIIIAIFAQVNFKEFYYVLSCFF